VLPAIRNILFGFDAALIHWTFPGGEMGFEVGGKKLERAFNGWARHRDQIAKAFVFVEGEDFAKLFEDWGAALPCLNFFQQSSQRARFHPAGGTLAAGFRREEFRDLNHFFNNAGAFCHQPNDAAT
jgi:hypothetical protein